MSTHIRSGLVSAAGLLVLTLFSGLICQLCGPIGAILVGVMAGVLSQRWGEPDPQTPPAQNGAIAGAIGGVGGWIGSTLSASINTLLLSSGTTQSAPYLEDVSGTMNPQDPIFILSGIGVWSCVGLFGIALAAGAGALAAHLSKREVVLFHDQDSQETIV